MGNSNQGLNNFGINASRPGPEERPQNLYLPLVGTPTPIRPIINNASYVIRPLPPRPHSVNPRIVVALFDYRACEESDVSFNKGDRMEVINDNEKDWWKVKHLDTNREGLIPWNFVAEEFSVTSEDWFFEKVTRKEAEKLLLLEENPRGTFLVRPSEGNSQGYSLSVKDWEREKGFQVKHYRIQILNNNKFYISEKRTFPSLQELIKAYTKEALGLCHVLSKPCLSKQEPQMWDLSPKMRDIWEINRTEIQLISQLGFGNFGEVWYGKWKGRTEVAVKIFRKGTMSTQAFLGEATIMKNFRHKNLVVLYAVCSKEEPIYIVQEYMCNGSLLEFLRNGDGKNLAFEGLTDIAYQVASGMEYLESKSLIHRDLAARNVLIGKNNEAKICDFGLARVIKDENYISKGSQFPVKWTAPEAINYGKFSIKSDVWSYGIFLMELLTFGKIPYPGMSGHEAMERVLNGYRMPKPKNPDVSDDMYRTILECWDDVPERRPTFESLKYYFQTFHLVSEIPFREECGLAHRSVR